MKKIIFTFFAVILLLTVICVPVLATETGTAVIESQDKNAAAQQFVQYIFSGEEGSEELMNKIIEMGDQYMLSKEQGYTLKERLLQMLTTENLVVLSASVFIVVCGIAFFVIETKRKKDRKATVAYIARLEKKYNEEIASNADIRNAILEQSILISDMVGRLGELCEASEKNKLDLDNVTKANQSVAKMVKDVFLNSKTIDANAKSLLVHNYLEAVGHTEKEMSNEQQS